MHPGLDAFLAQTAPTGQSPLGAIGSFLPLILIFVVFWFVFIRPQSKQQKQHQGFIAGLKKGDAVVTQGGIIGQVVLVEDRTVTIDVGGGNKLRVLKTQVASAWREGPAAEPVKTEAKK